MTIKFPFYPIFAAYCIFLFSPTANSNGDIEFLFSNYQDSAGLYVLTPSFNLRKELGESNSINFRYVFETFDKENPPLLATVDAISSASSVSGGSGGGFQDKRHEYRLSGSHRFSTAALGGAIYASTETDFSSVGYSVDYAHEFAQKNFTLWGLFGGLTDKIDNLNPQPNENWPKDKDVGTFTFGGTQLINPKFFISGGLSYSRAQGYQSSPLRKIITKEPLPAGGSISHLHEESHPETRDRNTLFFKAKQHIFENSAVDVNLSYYTDDWGVSAQHLTLGFYNHLNDHMQLRLRLRIYDQSQADFYQEIYKATETYMSADTRLRAFTYLLIGSKISYNLSRHGLKGWSTTFAIDWYKENNAGVNASILKWSLRIPY